ncbi:efflux RND transporter periplasmic adaptor subunit [Shewanella youngdeokensis]|uniref:Efflux RND transporter periplasmic adaptor subunit n=1 Tax=Shewanella youngdeokensis TaxID=2999068 RepID=A0ABZ0JWT0_9GAMM|nr:efflux RND transporter periplasmic adaptor subunit [Shewanella sp. DAU334]
MATDTSPKVTLLLFLLSCIAFSSSANVHPTAPKASTLTVAHKTYPNWVTLDAVIEPSKAATVSAQTSGRIIKINYDVNDVVAKDAPLLEITSKEQGAALAAAQADYAKANALNIEAQATLQRYNTLFPQGAIAAGLMDEARAYAKSTQQAMHAAKAGITQATESLNYTVVSAPFAGVVTQRHVQQGETVSPGQALYSGYSLTNMRAVAYVPQRYIDALAHQPKFKLSLANGMQLASDEINIFRFVDSIRRSYKVWITLPNSTDLQPGSLIKAQFVSGQRETLFIPQSALISANELNAVYLKQYNQWLLTQVRVGKKQGDQIEILAGLSDGDVIAVEADQTLLQLKQNKQRG